tara:strand:+ start:137 stop:1123 length:987 start_codon:yes stop_codon:yes gene_type:complete
MGKIGINMSGLLKKLSFRTGQSRRVVYYRPPIYGKDNYGVESNTVITNEINVPNVNAYIRNIVDKDYVVERGGHNITGKARIYLPNITTLKNYPNLNQDNNTNFNDITGFDQLIDYDRTIFVPTISSNTGWASGTMISTFAGEGYGGTTLTVTLGASASGTFTYTNAGANILESDRLTFQMKASGTLYFKGVNVYASGTTAAWKYGINASSTSSNVKVPTEEWLTIDVPYTSGTSLSSVYLSGTRYGFNVTQGASWKNGTYAFNNLEFDVSGASSKLYIKDLKFYKSSKWSVQKVNDYNDEYMVFDCVRTTGKRDKIRRAYGTGYNTP